MGEGAVTVFAIACNYAVSVSESARGSRAYVLNVNYGGGSERVRILMRLLEWLQALPREDRNVQLDSARKISENHEKQEIRC